jgi:outer membrane immunogenic protein
MICSRVASLAASALLAIGTLNGARAADFSSPSSPLSSRYVVPAFTWSGFYIGAVGGYGSGNQQFSQVTSGGAAVNVPAWPDTSLKGGTIGATAGYNNQVGSVVFGVEGDMNWAAFKGSQDVSGFVGATGTVDGHTRNFGTFRGRIGYAFDRVLPYLTGGFYWSQTDLTVTANTTGGALVLRSTSNEPGWVIGAGLEVAVSDHWSVKGEYLHVKQDVKFEFPDLNASVETSGHQDLVRAGVNYRF